MLAALAIFCHKAVAQSDGVGIGTLTPHASAILHIESPGGNKGLLIPRLTRTQMNTISSVATEGLLVYDVTNSIFAAFIAGGWRGLNPVVTEGLTNSDVYFPTPGKVGIGAAPAGPEKLQVFGNVNVSGSVTAGSYTGINATGNISTSANITAAGTVTASSFSGNGIVPAGGIIMWSGDVNSIPAGWALCDGTQNTPNLRGRFIVGYSDLDGDYAMGNTGGEKRHAITLEEMPSHNHTYSAPLQSGDHPGGNNGYDRPNGVNSGTTGSRGGLFHPAQYDYNGYPCPTDEFGYPYDDGMGCNFNYGNLISNSYIETVAFENRPPYYTLAYIMKL